jgi:hypothetical protein
MTESEQIQHLKNSLAEILDAIIIHWWNSAAFQYYDYKAKDGKDNWLSRARKLINNDKN